MAVTEQGQAGTGTGSGNESEQLRRAFEEGPTAFELLRGMRTRRVGLGYRIDSGTTEKHPVTGHEMQQMEGPSKFVSKKQPVKISEVEEALLAWAAHNGKTAKRIDVRAPNRPALLPASAAPAA